MSWLDSPKIHPLLREMVLENPDGQLEVMVYFMLWEPTEWPETYPPESEEDEERRLAVGDLRRKIAARSRGEDVSQEELDAARRRVAALPHQSDAEKEASRRASYAWLMAVYRNAREVGMRRLEDIPGLHILRVGSLGPFVTLRVSVPQLAELVALDDVGRIEKLLYLRGSLGYSHQVVRVDVAHASAYQGFGQGIVVFDTGIHKGMPRGKLSPPDMQDIDARHLVAEAARRPAA